MPPPLDAPQFEDTASDEAIARALSVEEELLASQAVASSSDDHEHQALPDTTGATLSATVFTTPEKKPHVEDIKPAVPSPLPPRKAPIYLGNIDLTCEPLIRTSGDVRIGILRSNCC